jgi:molybdate transport system substrate-binding protein
VSGELHVLCAGAVRGLLLALRDGFERDSGERLEPTFGAVGAIRDLLRSGAACDVFIASEAMIESLQTSGELQAGSQSAVGRVQTALAVRAGAPAPALADSDALRAALLGASAIYFPDATLSTAGAHVAAIVDRLGLREALAARLRMFANGTTAMRELAEHGDARALGCTQATEIVATPGIVLAGPLPQPFALATVYGAAIASGARDRDGARRFIDRLSGAASAAQRRAAGFEIDGGEGAPRAARARR